MAIPAVHQVIFPLEPATRMNGPHREALCLGFDEPRASKFPRLDPGDGAHRRKWVPSPKSICTSVRGRPVWSMSLTPCLQTGPTLCFVAGLDLIEMEIQPSEDHGFDAVAIEVRP